MSGLVSNELKDAFQTIGLEAGDKVFVHSALFKFRGLMNVEIDDIPKVVTESLLDVVGPKGGIYVPTFTFSFCEGEPFDIRNTPSEMGALTEYIRQRDDSVRSPHPMQSITGIGPDANDICKRDTRTTYSSEGPIDALYEQEAKVLCLGVPFMSSPFHYVEERVGVPYRFWKEFNGEYTDQSGHTQNVTYEMYVRDLKLNPQLDPTILESELPKEAVQRTEINNANILSFSFEVHFNKMEEMLNEDPFSMIAKMNSGVLDE
jgi:aminoglycoside 3-N-acetyltransferase